MAKTIRRATGHNWWHLPNTHPWELRHFRGLKWKWSKANGWLSDKYARTDNILSDPYTQNLKHQTKRRRRVNTRHQLHKMIREGYDDFVNYEKMYKGYIWNWD